MSNLVVKHCHKRFKFRAATQPECYHKITHAQQIAMLRISQKLFQYAESDANEASK